MGFRWLRPPEGLSSQGGRQVGFGQPGPNETISIRTFAGAANKIALARLMGYRSPPPIYDCSEKYRGVAKEMVSMLILLTLYMVAEESFR